MISKELKDMAKKLYETQKNSGFEMKLWHKLPNNQKRAFYLMARLMKKEKQQSKLDGLAEAFELVDVDFTSLHGRITKYKREWEKNS